MTATITTTKETTMTQADFTTVPEASTPVLDEIRRLIRFGGDVPIKVKGGATFLPGQFYVLTHTGKQWNEDGKYDTVVSYIEIHVHGTMTYKDRTDSAATVTLRWALGREAAYTTSSAWDGTKFREMPEGARRHVAEAVQTLAYGGNGIDWEALALEHQRAEAARTWRSVRDTFYRDIAQARETFERVSAQPTPLAKVQS